MIEIAGVPYAFVSFRSMSCFVFSSCSGIDASDFCRDRRVLIDASRCDADASGAMGCSIEMDARRSQLKRLLQRVHEATKKCKPKAS